ncbi:sprouty-related, EVH1 domain-containing protein 2-like [Thunnus maccoyii]|uniref:sprouty-related, EVH1 domain-containing protein 2-like n=1 Tax=Thunnus maccoyii TaxID=8240 RepID=UPI001C4ABF6B|nr:sprouty-related, EVH1 domain-containing protein 2-like [Thunnus maccoyii]
MANVAAHFREATEQHLGPDLKFYCVRVRAVVMTRDDSSGGWVPLGGGGFSDVVICKGRSHDGRGRREYIIRGERLRDRAVSVQCWSVRYKGG